MMAISDIVQFRPSKNMNNQSISTKVNSDGSNGGGGSGGSGGDSSLSVTPYAYIVEQPAKCGVRFRYECEGRISSAIPGASSGANSITYPTVAVANYEGPVKVIVSCVTKNQPYRPHPHNLVGKKYCNQGICVAKFPFAYCQFTNLGILCAKRKDVRERLRVREQLQVDPFQTGFSHRLQTFKLIDLNVVRLCFQVFLPDSNGKFTRALPPIVSDEIHDKKAMSELSINRLSHYSASVTGGQSVIMLCDRVIKDDIQIRFFQYAPDGQKLLWEKNAEFNARDVHKHFAICFRVPPYDLPIDSTSESIMIPVGVQLRRPSDGCTSEVTTFYYTANEVTNTSSNSSLLKMAVTKSYRRTTKKNVANTNLLDDNANNDSVNYSNGNSGHSLYRPYHHDTCRNSTSTSSISNNSGQEWINLSSMTIDQTNLNESYNEIVNEFGYPQTSHLIHQVNSNNVLKTEAFSDTFENYQPSVTHISSVSSELHYLTPHNFNCHQLLDSSNSNYDLYHNRSTTSTLNQS